MAVIPDVIAPLLRPFQPVWLATTDGQRPYVRPVTLIVHKGRLFTATGSEDAKLEQLAANASIEWALELSADAGRGYIRAAGEAEIVADQILRAEIFAAAPFMKDHFDSPDSPSYVLLQFDIRSYDYLQPGDTWPTTHEA